MFPMTRAITGNPIQFNLPIVPITDLAFHKRDDEMVVATQGRAFWIMDDLDLLCETEGRRTDRRRAAVQARRKRPRRKAEAVASAVDAARSAAGTNPPSGAMVEFWLKEKPTGDVTLEILDSAGKLVNKYSSHAPKSRRRKTATKSRSRDRTSIPSQTAGPARVPAQQGMNRFVWDHALSRRDDVPGPDHVGRRRRAVQLIVPGTYTVKLTVGWKNAVADIHRS